MKCRLSLIFLFCFSISFAQTGIIAYSHEYEFKEGVYLSLDQFKQNAPIPKSAFVTDIPKNQLDFFSELLENPTFTYKDANGTPVKIESTTAWGYSQNRSVYLNYNKEFNRVNVIGTVFHFTAAVRVLPSYHDPLDYSYGIANGRDEIRQFILDTQTNRVNEFTVPAMEIVLKEDAELYAKFEALRKREKVNSIFIYLRKYNEKHPLYLPAN